MSKLFFLIPFFYFLVLLQTSFFVHFSIFGIMPNFVLLAIILLNLFQEPKKSSGIFISALAGFFADIFSQNFMGFWTAIAISLSLFIKFILLKYIVFKWTSFLKISE